MAFDLWTLKNFEFHMFVCQEIFFKKIFLSSYFKVYNYPWLSGHVKVSGWSQPLTSTKTFLLCSKDQLEVSDVQLGTLTNTFSQRLFQEKFILKPPR